MRDIDLFQAALGLTAPWRLEAVELDEDEGRLDLHIDFVPGGSFPCPVCGREDCKAYDPTPKEWRHLNLFQHEAYLHAPVPRVRCPEHGVKQVGVPWARPGSGFTLLFEAFVLALVRQMPVAAVGRGVGDLDGSRVVFDKFHVMKLVNDAVDEVRRAEQKDRPELKRSPYVWLKNPENLTRKQRALLENLSPKSVGLNTSRAYQMKLALQEFWTLPPVLAEDFLKRWYFWATDSRLDPMIRIAKTLKKHWDGLLSWFHSHIGNGILEGINSLIQAAKDSIHPEKIAW
jgi:transposase